MTEQLKLLEELTRRGQRAQKAVDDILKGERLKRRGMEVAAAKRSPMVAALRNVAMAVALSRASHECSMNDVRERLAQKGLPLSPGNWMGCIFADGRWEFTGRWEPSRHAKGHARPVRVWRLL